MPHAASHARATRRSRAPAHDAAHAHALQPRRGGARPHFDAAGAGLLKSTVGGLEIAASFSTVNDGLTE